MRSQTRPNDYLSSNTPSHNNKHYRTYEKQRLLELDGKFLGGSLWHIARVIYRWNENGNTVGTVKLRLMQFWLMSLCCDAQGCGSTAHDGCLFTLLPLLGLKQSPVWK